MDPVFFALSVLALLSAPGPTNTLLAASGAAVGWRRSLGLVPAEIAGYGVSIATLVALAGPLIANHPGAVPALKLLASLWLVVCAVKLWREAGSGFAAMHRPISIPRVFLATLVNPKGLIFAFGIFPKLPLLELAPWFGGFFGLVFLVGMGWVTLGMVIARSAGHWVTPRRVWRAAALGLAAFAILFAGSAIVAVS